MTGEDNETVAQKGAKWDALQAEALIFERDVLALENKRLREERDAAVDARTRWAAEVGRLREEVERLTEALHDLKDELTAARLTGAL